MHPEHAKNAPENDESEQRRIMNVPVTTLIGESLSRFTTSDVARFWSKVHKTSTCWLWTASVFGSLGYGQFSTGRVLRGGRMVPWPVYAHRVAWELANGPIPVGQHILHRCDRPICVNPDHLFLGTQRDNNQDAARKGRLHVSRPTAQKVTDAQVSQMKALVASGMLRVRVAEQFGVSKAFITQIMGGTRRKYPREVA